MKARKFWTHIDGIPRLQWWEYCRTVKANRSTFGLRPIFASLDICQCGYCKRHQKLSKIEYKNIDGDALCEPGSVLWAVHKYFGIPTKMEDL